MMTTDEILATNWEDIVGSGTVCTCSGKDCGVTIQESISGMHYFDGKPVCSDCYFGLEMEKILREHPIESPPENVTSDSADADA